MARRAQLGTMSKAWQRPYVNVFKHFGVGSWTKSCMQGEVSEAMNKTVRAKVFRISGSVPASNFIQIPKASSQSMGLVGGYLLLQFRVVPGKYFVMHFDLATDAGLVVRVSISNLFKEFKCTSTWLQFPFTELSSRWTLLVLDMRQLLSVYLNRRFSYLKVVKFCANMTVRNMFTTDQELQEDKLPRDMTMFVPKGKQWHDVYDCIRFPGAGADHGATMGGHQGVAGQLVHHSNTAPVSRASRFPDRQNQQRQSAFKQGTAVVRHHDPRQPPAKGLVKGQDLPAVGLNQNGANPLTDHARNVELSHAVDQAPELKPEHRALLDRTNSRVQIQQVKLARPRKSPKSSHRPSETGPAETLDREVEPPMGGNDGPVLCLRKILGYTPFGSDSIWWTPDGCRLVYACHSTIVSMDVSTGSQKFFLGHTDEVSALAMTGNGKILASTQTGRHPVIRLWNPVTGRSIGLITHKHPVLCLSFSFEGLLLGVGKEHHGKQLVMVWDAREDGGAHPKLLSKGYTDAEITLMKVSPMDDNKFVSCGNDNIRVWRIKRGELRSCPINTAGQTRAADRFTDMSFLASSLDAIRCFVSSTSGQVFRVNCSSMALEAIFDLHDSPIHSISVCAEFCMTGTQNGELRAWSPTFDDFIMEAKHEGPIVTVQVSLDGRKVVAGTITGNLGVLDAEDRSYMTVMRSHCQPVTCVVMDDRRKQFATVSQDETIRVWNRDTHVQLYEFRAPGDQGCCAAYPPTAEFLLAVGFASGTVRVFDIASTSVLAEHQQHHSSVVMVVYSPDGQRLLSVGTEGAIVQYDATQSYNPLRVTHLDGCTAAAASHDKSVLAVLGAQQTVFVFDTMNMAELQRIDLASVHGHSTEAVVCIQISNGGSTLYGVTNKEDLLVFDLSRRQLVKLLASEHHGHVTALSVCDSPGLLLSGGDDCILKVRSLASLRTQEAQSFIGHAAPLRAIAYSAQDHVVFSAAHGVFLWDYLGATEELQTTTTQPGDDGGEAVADGDGGDDAVLPAANLLSENDLRVAFDLFAKGNNGFIDRRRFGDVVKALGIQVPQQRLQELEPEYSSGHWPLGFQEFAGMMAELLSDHELVARDNATAEHEGSTNQLRLADLRGGAATGITPRPLPVPASFTPVQPHPDLTFQSLVDHQSDQPPAGNSTESKPLPVQATSRDIPSFSEPPRVMAHFPGNHVNSKLATHQFVSPPSQAGMMLQSMLGFSNGRHNVKWHPTTGLFVYTSGCVVVLEDLAGQPRTQRHLRHHVEQISTISLQNDGLGVASASGPSQHTNDFAEICLWDVESGELRHVLRYHVHDIGCMAFSRDDLRLVSVGNYLDSVVAVWSVNTGEQLAASQAEYPVNGVQWDPYNSQEFVSVGQHSSLLFWMLDETSGDATLNVHCTTVPSEAEQQRAHLTSVCYGDDSTLFVGDSTGVISVWDTRKNACNRTWQAESEEIITLLASGNRLLTGGVSRGIKLWTMADDAPGSLILQDAIAVDGPVVSACFDVALAMGVVATLTGTVWSVDWQTRDKLRLVFGHSDQINGLDLSGDGKFALTGARDGSIRLWSLTDMEAVVGFQVTEMANDQCCNCVALAPNAETCVAGFGDGVIRMFDVVKVQLIAKFVPHDCAVVEIVYSRDGKAIVSGNALGGIVLSHSTTGMTLRAIQDHRGARISCIDFATAPTLPEEATDSMLWLAASDDRRVSVWSSDWLSDKCELVDWLTFAAPEFVPQPETKNAPPTLARFSPTNSDVILYCGFGHEKEMLFYSISLRQIIKHLRLNQWALSMHVSPSASLVAIGTEARLVKLVDTQHGNFQDFVLHSDSVHSVLFSPDGRVVSVGHDDVAVWRVRV
eukprot:m.231562 g.231562  ORF g.231562 m.231562 type:complete len:1844 (-) comp18876_c0_seq6:786-6317(-)